jgi:hypothetical protein
MAAVALTSVVTVDIALGYKLRIYANLLEA